VNYVALIEFPNGLDTFTVKVDGPENIVMADHINKLQEAVVAIEPLLLKTKFLTEMNLKAYWDRQSGLVYDLLEDNSGIDFELSTAITYNSIGAVVGGTFISLPVTLPVVPVEATVHAVCFGSDYSIFISRDDGQTWLPVTLGTPIDLTTAPVGSTMRIKVDLNTSELAAFGFSWKGV
jgi:hypothetical protein